MRRIRSVRSGMGLGKGKGYSNMIPKDPNVHKDSAKGIKQPENPIIMTPEPHYDSYQQEIVDLMGKDNLEQIQKDYGDITEFREEDDHYFLEAGGMEFLVFKSEDDAVKFAEEQVREDLETDPQMFSKDWLQSFVYITDTDRRIISGEESDNYIENMTEEEIVKEAGNEDEYDSFSEKVDDLETQEALLPDGKELSQTKKEYLKKLITERQKLITDSTEEARDKRYDEIYESLEDPIRYFVDEQGIYSREELLKQSFMSIDYERATEDAVSTDGWQHFIATYDGDSIDLKDGWVMARTN